MVEHSPREAVILHVSWIADKALRNSIITALQKNTDECRPSPLLSERQ